MKPLKFQTFPPPRRWMPSLLHFFTVAIFIGCFTSGYTRNVFPETEIPEKGLHCMSGTATSLFMPVVEIEITGDTLICDGERITLRANVLSNPTQTATYNWSVLSFGPGTSGTFSSGTTQTTNFTGVVNPAIIPPGGSGIVTIQLIVTDGNGDMDFDTIRLKLFRESGSLACNDQVHISLDGDCMAVVQPDDVLEGTYPDYELYEVVIFDRGRNIGNVVTGAQIGRTMQVRVIDRCSGNYCWGTLTVEDKMAPVINCNVTNTVTSITGTIDPADATYNRTVTFVPGSPPGSCLLSNVGTNVNFEAFNFSIPASGTYTFDMVATSIPDAFGALYSHGFNPALPCLNLVAADDDSHPAPPILSPRIVISLGLVPGNYTLVTSTHFNNMAGTYQWNITGPILPNGNNAGVIPISDDTITINCNDDPNAVPPPIAVDNCDVAIVPQLIGETFQDFNCGRPDNVIRIVERTWRAKDKYNNYSKTCKQIIKMVRRSLADIDFPPDYDDMTMPALDCAEPMSNAHPDSLENGWPDINGVPVTNNNFCKFNLGYRDVILPICGRSKKILREWTVLDWCAPLLPGVNPRTHTQLIKFLDKTPPVVVCPRDTIFASTDPSECTGTVLFPPIQATDNCSGIIVQISTPYGVVQGNGGFVSDFPIGDYPVTYTVSDSCGNTTICRRILRVEDKIEPVAVCIEFLTTSLTIAGIAEVFATSFDAGSYDNCCLDIFEVKRMSEPDSAFGPSVVFTCDDAGDSVMVVVRVWDCYGNYNTCMVNVDVRDKLPPNLTCPRNTTIGCKDDKDDLTLTGRPTAVDGCPILRVTYTDVDQRNRCGVGTILRTFIAEDVNGNRRTCNQTITVINDHPFDSTTIVWPKDSTFINDCGRGLHPDSLPPGYDYPTFPRDLFCADLMMRYEDEVFNAVQGACFKILRTWTIIDWCSYDTNNPNDGGRWVHRQTLKVIDNEGPVLTCPDSLVFYAGPTCTANVTITQPPATDCSSNITFSVSGNLTNQFGTINNVPIGTYDVIITASDGCRNSSVCSYPVIIRDTTPPTPICQDVIAVIGIDMQVIVNARSMDRSSYDNCTPASLLHFSFSSNILDTTRTFFCPDKGINIVRLYVTDAFGNQDFCIDTIVVQDNAPFNCAGSRPAIAGSVKRKNGDPIEAVNVSISGNTGQYLMTGPDGHFMFPDLQTGADYTIYPRRDDGPGNGVTTYDLSLISKHILTVEPFGTPYQIIAADANNSRSVTTMDIVTLRKLILRIIDELPNNTSWRFVKADFVFPNPRNPWETRFPEVHSINNLSRTDMAVDFIAIKVGDVNGNATPGRLLNVDERSLKDPLAFEAVEQELRTGEYYRMDFRSSNFANIAGYQYTLHFNTERLQFAEVIPGEISGTEDFGLRFVDQGMITTGWHSAKATTLPADAVLFSLRFKALADGKCSENLWIDGNLTAAEAYKDGGEQLQPTLHFRGDDNRITDAKAPFQLYQNEPNPFDKQTVIRFSLPASTEATLSVFDLSGRVLKVIKGHYSEGINEITLTKDELQQKGVLYYRLQTNGQEAIKKMILIE